MQVSRTISTCSLHLCNIGLIHRYLTQPTVTATLCCLGVQPITSADCSDFITQPLALLLARLVVKVRCLFFANCTGYPFSSVLHSRSLSLRTRRCTPVYMQKLVCIYKPARCLRFADTNTLVVMRSRSRAENRYSYIYLPT